MSATFFSGWATYKWRASEEQLRKIEEENERIEKIINEEQRKNEECKRIIRNPTHDEVKKYIRVYFNGNSEWAIRTAYCESGFQPRVKSKYGNFYGLFQFCKQTYAGWGGKDIYNWMEQVRVVANRVNKYGLAEVAKHFPVCGRR